MLNETFFSDFQTLWIVGLFFCEKYLKNENFFDRLETLDGKWGWLQQSESSELSFWSHLCWELMVRQNWCCWPSVEATAAAAKRKTERKARNWFKARWSVKMEEERKREVDSPLADFSCPITLFSRVSFSFEESKAFACRRLFWEESTSFDPSAITTCPGAQLSKELSLLTSQPKSKTKKSLRSRIYMGKKLVLRLMRFKDELKSS